jgi:AcrR family transcriptional regulator
MEDPMQQRSEETREHILASAADLFSKHGYDATGVAEICQAAGVSKGAFYHHFPSKHIVFLTLLNNWLDGLMASVSVYPQEDTAIPDSLVRMADLMNFVYETAHGKLPLFLEFWLRSSRDPVVWKATIQPYHQFQAYFASLFQRGIRDGTIKPVEPQQAARAIISLAMGVLLQGLLDPQETDWGQVAHDSVQFMMHGIAVSSSR